VKAVLRRTRPKVSSAELSMGDITVNVDKHLVMNRDEEILLTFKEFELLRYMIENKGIALTRNNILEKIWGYDSECETRTVDVHIRTLRQKLGESGDLIKTIRGVGYRMG
ncbi:MAG TPA: response regulator transcription factor, partial [Clostridiales bacterium]|nr:response regulator transcription factor [Clostridiales bacterium]